MSALKINSEQGRRLKYQAFFSSYAKNYQCYGEKDLFKKPKEMPAHIAVGWR